MIDDLDVRLGRIASVTLTDELEGLEHAVLGRIATERAQTDTMLRLGVVAVTGALLLGGLSSLDQTRPTQAAGAFEMLGGASALAPSTLLGGS
ncbi:hypothetical protein O6V14_00910 [Sphingomonas faeni]|uniref:hypothetical protein n=1 Tax=Sphingomonas faeni TaxID=185950 RepID=UPI003352BBDD